MCKNLFKSVYSCKHRHLKKTSTVIDQNWPYLKSLCVLSSTFCLPGELWTPQTVWHQDIMVTQYHPGNMSSIFIWHNWWLSVHHHLITEVWCVQCPSCLPVRCGAVRKLREYNSQARLLCCKWFLIQEMTVHASISLLHQVGPGRLNYSSLVHLVSDKKDGII